MNIILKEKSENGTFCVLPWIHQYSTASRFRRLCCLAKGSVTEELAAEHRTNLYNNKKIIDCSTCWHHESSGIESLRQKSNKFWLNEINSQEYFNQFTETSTPAPKSLYYDLRASNKCNLACIMCNPDSSSMWRQELGMPPITEKVVLNHADILANALRIDLLGGEPFLIDEYVNLLSFLADNNSAVKINIFTNLTALKPETLDIIKKLKNISIVISIDSWEKVQEYHRYPLKWEKFMRNLNELNNTNVAFSFNTVASAISVLNWDKLVELENYNFKEWSIFSLAHPPALQVKNIPTKFKQSAYESILKLTNIKYYKYNKKFKDSVDYLLKQVMEEGNSEMLVEFIKELDQRRGIDHADYLGINLC